MTTTDAALAETDEERARLDAEHRRAYVHGLYDLADFLADHPELIPGRNLVGAWQRATVTVLVGRDRFAPAARALGGEVAFHGGGARIGHDQHFSARRAFGPHALVVQAQASDVGRYVGSRWALDPEEPEGAVSAGGRWELLPEIAAAIGTDSASEED